MKKEEERRAKVAEAVALLLLSYPARPRWRGFAATKAERREEMGELLL